MARQTAQEKRMAQTFRRAQAITRAVERGAAECTADPATCGFRGSGKLCLKEWAAEQGGYHPDCGRAVMCGGCYWGDGKPDGSSVFCQRAREPTHPYGIEHHDKTFSCKNGIKRGEFP